MSRSMRGHLITVKNEKFRKMPKIGLVKNRVFFAKKAKKSMLFKRKYFPPFWARPLASNAKSGKTQTGRGTHRHSAAIRRSQAQSRQGKRQQAGERSKASSQTQNSLNTVCRPPSYQHSKQPMQPGEQPSSIYNLQTPEYTTCKLL